MALSTLIDFYELTLNKIETKKQKRISPRGPGFRRGFGDSFTVPQLTDSGKTLTISNDFCV